MHLPPARARRLAPSSRPHRPFWPGALDRPSATEPISGRTAHFAGWAWPFVDQRVKSVELLLDDAPMGTALLTLRPDIAEAIGRPEAALCGFEARLELSPAAFERDAVQVSARVDGLAGGTWVIPPQLVRVEPAPAPPHASSSPEPRDVADPGLTAVDPPPPTASRDRELLRRRLGYDPWHVVVLIEGAKAVSASGAAIAALDLLAERHPNLELLIPGIAPESVFADVARRTITAMGLEDRVTVPRIEQEPGYWRAVADLPIDGSKATDLGAMIESLSAADRSGPRGA